MGRRNIFIWALVVALAMLALPQASSRTVWAEDVPAKLVIGYQYIPNAEIVVKDLGWNEKELGIPVEWIPLSSGVQGHRGLAEGKLDIALLGSSPAALGIVRGIPLQVIWIHDIIADNEALVVKNNSGIDRVEDLVGKTVATPFGSTSDYMLHGALALAHINTSDLSIVNMEPRDMLAAWKRNEIDAGFVWVPTLAEMIRNGGKVLLTGRQMAQRGFPTGDLCVVRREFAERYPEVVLKYLINQDRGVKYIRSHPKESAAAIARQLGLSETEAANQLKGVVLLTADEQMAGQYFGGVHWNFGLYNILKETADFLKEVGVVSSLPPRDAFMAAVNAAFLVWTTDKKVQ